MTSLSTSCEITKSLINSFVLSEPLDLSKAAMIAKKQLLYSSSLGRKLCKKKNN